MRPAEGFNEAPALRRGKCEHPRQLGRNQPAASMRPRHYAGESVPVGVACENLLQGFNEAPALRRGKSPPSGNDAANTISASMRPRHYAGESCDEGRSGRR